MRDSCNIDSQQRVIDTGILNATAIRENGSDLVWAANHPALVFVESAASKYQQIR